MGPLASYTLYHYAAERDPINLSNLGRERCSIDGKLRMRKTAAPNELSGSPKYYFKNLVILSSRGCLYGDCVPRRQEAVHVAHHNSLPYMSAGMILSCSAFVNAIGRLPNPAAVILPLILYMPTSNSSLQGRNEPFPITLIPKNRRCGSVFIVTSPSVTYLTFLSPTTITLHLCVDTYKPKNDRYSFTTVSMRFRPLSEVAMSLMSSA